MPSGWSRLIEGDATGTFNVVGPATKQTLAQFVDGLRAAGHRADPYTWIEDYAWLKAYPLRKPAPARPPVSPKRFRG